MKGNPAAVVHTRFGLLVSRRCRSWFVGRFLDWFGIVVGVPDSVVVGVAAVRIEPFAGGGVDSPALEFGPYQVVSIVDAALVGRSPLEQRYRGGLGRSESSHELGSAFGTVLRDVHVERPGLFQGVEDFSAKCSGTTFAYLVI
jgi:hypothetical protein